MYILFIVEFLNRHIIMKKFCFAFFLEVRTNKFVVTLSTRISKFLQYKFVTESDSPNHIMGLVYCTFQT